MSLPTLDIAADEARLARELRAACTEVGFFRIAGVALPNRIALTEAARAFFALAPEAKARIGMERGGSAWRGSFALGAEETLGVPDHKEGLYFGAEHEPDDPRVLAGTPLYGANLFPDEVPELRELVLRHCADMTALGHRLMELLALGLERSYFRARYTEDPVTLFRIFHYPPHPPAGRWSVAEHTDYGVLTILMQDDCGGLEVRGRTGWIEVPAEPDILVCNLGDMLERMTGGLFRSTLHRVRNASDRGRLSFPFFFDPAFDARIAPIHGSQGEGLRIDEDDPTERWDGRSVHAFEGTYGDYLVDKVSRVFPELAARHLRR